MSKPYGVNHIVIKKGDQVVQLPVAQTLEFEERMTSGELPGDDVLAAIAANTNGVTWKLKNGGIPLDAYALMTGRTVSETGSTPNVVRTLEGGGDGLRMPYFDIYGKSLGDAADDACEALAFRGRQSRRRLVEQDHLGLAGQRARHFEEAALAE